MVRHRANAWLTTVLKDESVLPALVLASSLRKSGTDKRIGVIISKENVSKDGRIKLHEAFDDVYQLDDCLVPPSPKETDNDCKMRARIFAFSLDIFEKCILLENNSVVFENVDYLFEHSGQEQDFSVCMNPAGKDDEEEKMTMATSSVFLLYPSMALFKYLAECSEKFVKKSSLLICIRNWFENNCPSNYDSREMYYFPENFVTKFSLKSGSILQGDNGTINCHPGIVEFVEDENSMDILTRLGYLKQANTLGLYETVIVDTWLDIYGKVSTNQVNDYLSSAKDFENEPIAIVGMSCRFPGANNLADFWKLLYNGEEAIREPPAFRWRKEHSIIGLSGKERQTNAGFLSTSVDDFDAKFFGISPKEALFLDPQSRLLHEVLWEALENGGIDPLSLHGSHTGIFTGSWMIDYKDIVQRSTDKDFFRGYLGNSMGSTAARLSFQLGLTGPCIATESGCSSAIVAVDMAVKSLRCGETNMAIAGGVNLLLHPFQGNVIDYVVAPDGRCKTFDAKADGFGRAEGCGVLVLKKLSDAMADGDNVWAVVRGSAVAQEGISRSLGTPTVQCEALAMKLALKDGGVRPEQVSFVETHGTGTSVGDPMEVAAIANAYHSESRKSPLIIGSVKTNVGHTESCSGITGIIKTVLAMHYECIPKHLNLETLNPHIDLDSIPAQIPLERMTWPKDTTGGQAQKRLAGVSSFGITGTDGHVVLQEAPDSTLERFQLGLERPLHLIKISGKSKQALEELIKLYQETFEIGKEESKPFADMAYTANIGRASFKHRAFLLAKDYDDAVQQIKKDKILYGEITSSTSSDQQNGKICFLFTGQGSQYPGMARTLYETSPVFRIHFDYLDRVLRETYNLSIGHTLWDTTSSKQLNRTIYSQTSIFCVEYCLLKLWESWNIQPDYILGHSLGEFCAAVCAGILSLDDALKLVVERSKLIDMLPSGSMLVINAGLSEVTNLLKKVDLHHDLDVAAVNSHEQTVLAGDTEKISKFLGICKENKLKAVILDATHAFHSRHMEPILEKYRKVAETINYDRKSKVSSCQYISGMEGRLLDCPSQEINADYWVRHTREQVSFLEACQVMKKLECCHFLEIGPHPVLSTFVMQNITVDVPYTACYPSLRRNGNDWETMMISLGKLYLQAFPVDWKAFDKPYNRKKVTNLPFHPFHRKPFWVECNVIEPPSIHPLLGHVLPTASNCHFFETQVTINRDLSYLRDHCIGDTIVFPGAGFTEMCLSAGYCAANSLAERFDKPRHAIALENVRIDAPLEIYDGKSCKLQTLVSLQESEEEKGSAGYEVKIFHEHQSDDQQSNWVFHTSAKFLPFVSVNSVLSEKWNEEKVKSIIATQEVAEMTEFYKAADNTGLKFGESFRSLKRHWRKEPEQSDDVVGGGIKMDEIVAEMRVPDDFDKYLLHPLAIDTMMQTALLAGFKSNQPTGSLRVPVRIGKLTFLGCHAESTTEQSDSDVLYLHAKWYKGEKVTVFLTTKNFQPIAILEDLEVLETNVKTIQSVLATQTKTLPDSWEEIWKQIPHGPVDNRVELLQLEHLKQEIFTGNEEFKKRLREVDDLITEEDAEQARKLCRLVYLYVLNAFMELGWIPKLGDKFTVEEFMSKFQILECHEKQIGFYFTLLRDEGGIMERKLGSDDGLWEIKTMPPSHDNIKTQCAKLYEELIEKEKIPGHLIVYQTTATNLSEILTGKQSILPILFPVDDIENSKCSAEIFYNTHPCRDQCLAKNKEIIGTLTRHLKAKNEGQKAPHLRVLEVGAGTGSCSGECLAAFKEIWGGSFEYHYTDISAGFFGKAEKKFEEYAKSNLKFSTFNIEEPPLSQGIPLNYFDWIIAGDVVHATKNLKSTLSHLRQTLRPGGILYMKETLEVDKGITFIFGLLDGYWRFEDYDVRTGHCCINGKQWEELLLQSGFEFSFVEKVYLDEMGCVTAIADQTSGVDVRIVPCKEPKSPGEWLVFSHTNGDEDSNTVNITNCIVNALESCVGAHVTVVQPTSLDEIELGKNIASLLNGERDIQGILYACGLPGNLIDQEKISLPFFLLAKEILQMKKKAPRLYVLTKGVHFITEDSLDFEDPKPSASTLFGMVKSLKNENSDLFVRYIDLDYGDGDVSLSTEQVLYELAMCRNKGEKERLQVVYRNGLRYEPKFTRGDLGNKGRNDDGDLLLPSSTERYKLRLPESKMINDLQFEILDEEAIRLTGGKTEDKNETKVEVKIMSYSLNFRDVFVILKPSKEFEKFHTVGLDYAGVISRVGESEGENDAPKSFDGEILKPGDRVFGVHFDDGQLNSHLAVPAEYLLRIPENMTYGEASTIPTVAATCVYCLMFVAKITKEDTVLIHTGSGGIGLCAIMLAKSVGATMICTAGSARKRNYLRKLGVHHVFHSRNTSYEEGIMKATNGQGVTVVLNSLTGPGFKEASLRACAQNARFVEMSKLAVWTNEEVEKLRPDVKYSIVDMTEMHDPNSENKTWKKVLNTMKEYFKNRTITPLPRVTFDALRVRQALQYLQKARHIGKIVVNMPEATVKHGSWNVNVQLYNCYSTYLITGGLGGIGFEVCKWMLAKGATDIVLMGRSPPKPEVAAEIERLNKDERYNVVVKLGDVGNYDECKSVIDYISKECKPLRGIQHCAGVLRDNMYTNQTWETFSATYRPKVEGTWNLHNLTKDMPLESFVFYSSMTALVGTPSQANHTSANCFEDAFVHYRYSLGLPATTINWGQWSQVGIAKEVNITGVYPVSVKRMLNGLEEVIRSQTRQCVLGDFESMALWSVMIPTFKHYMDEKVLRMLNMKNSENGSKIHLKTDEFWKEIDEAGSKEEKLEVIMSYMKRIIRSALRMDPDEPINDDADMKDLGVDSLVLIELKNSIQSLLGSRLTITANMLKDCHTVREVSTCIINKLYESDESYELPALSPEELTALLNSDCELDPEIKPSSEPAEGLGSIKTCVVTGCTGQLGPYIVASLASPTSRVEKVYCIVRAKIGVTPRTRMEKLLESRHLKDGVQLEKLECLEGDMTLENFGLEKDIYEKLCRETDAIFHLAAKSNHIEEYRKCEKKKDKANNDVRSVNIGGTINALKFAGEQKTKYVYYASAVGSIFGGEGNGNTHLSDKWPGIESVSTIVEYGATGYPISKYVSEMLIKQAVDRGIPCKVFRFPWIMGDSKRGQINYMSNHYILRFLSYLKSKVMPMAPVPALVLPVDKCTDLSLNLFWNEEAPWEIYNIVHPDPQSEPEFVTVAKEHFNTDVELVDWKSSEFMEKLSGEGMPLESFKDFYKDIDRIETVTKSDAFEAIQGYINSPQHFFRGDKIGRFVPNFEQDLPESMETIKNNLMYAKENGFFKRFGM